MSRNIFQPTSPELGVADVSKRLASIERRVMSSTTGPQGEDGADGADGPPGPAGSPGADGPAGPPGLVARGAWSAATAYAARDWVTHLGSSYHRKIAGTTSTAPASDATNWEVLAAKGDTGDTGAPGAAGAAGATGATGAKGLTNRGGWNSSVAYVPDDVVLSNGESFVALLANTNVTPAPGATWQYLAQRGTAGTTGATGPAGAPGSQTYDGTGAPSSGVGTSGDWYWDTTNHKLYQKTGAGSGTWTLRFTVADGTNGTNGTNGTPGSQILNTIGVPGAGVGVNGDWAFNVSNGAVYQKQSGAWALMFSTIGPAGTNGANGADGKGFAFVQGTSQSNVNVSSPGTNLFDSTAVNAGEAVLLLAQVNDVENGPWIFNGTSTPMTRGVSGWGSGALVPTRSIVVVAGGVLDKSLWAVAPNGGADQNTVIVGTEGQLWTRVAATTAATVSNTPAGTIAATSVQGAIDELATEKIDKAILTTRGDLIRRGATAPERVALGASGAALMSDGTDAVWRTVAQRFKVGVATPPASPGTLVITGLGFRPSLITFNTTFSFQTTDAHFSAGSCDGALSQAAVAQSMNASGRATAQTTGNCVFLLTPAGATVVLANVSALSSDGFTLTFANTNTAARIVWTAVA